MSKESQKITGITRRELLNHGKKLGVALGASYLFYRSSPLLSLVGAGNSEEKTEVASDGTQEYTLPTKQIPLELSISADSDNNMLMANAEGLSSFTNHALPYYRFLTLDNNLSLDSTEAVPLFGNLTRYPFVQAMSSLTCNYNKTINKYSVIGVVRNDAQEVNLAYQTIGLDGRSDRAVVLFPENISLGRTAPRCIVLPNGTTLVAYYDYRNGYYNPPVANFFTISPDLKISAEQSLSDRAAAVPAISYNETLKRGIITMSGYFYPGSLYNIFDENGQIINKGVLDEGKHDSPQAVVSTPSGHFVFRTDLLEGISNQLLAYKISPDGDKVDLQSIPSLNGYKNFGDAVLAPDKNTILFTSHMRIDTNNYDIFMLQYDPHSGKILENRTYGYPLINEVFPKTAVLKDKRITIFPSWGIASTESRLVAITSNLKWIYKQYFPLDLSSS